VVPGDPPYKKSLTCTSTTADCDSSLRVLRGGERRAADRALQDIAAIGARAWARVDGLLAVRC
jgi:hypothetical protein